MAKTHLFTVNTGNIAVVTQIWTKSVTIQEDPSVTGWPTTGFNIKAPTSSDTAIQRPAGTSWTFTSPVGYYPPGKTIGYVSTVTGSTTFQQYEDGL